MPRTTGTNSRKTPASPEGSKALRKQTGSDRKSYRSTRGNRSTGKSRSPISGLYVQVAGHNSAQIAKESRSRRQSTIPIRGPRLAAPVLIDGAQPSRSSTTLAPHTQAAGAGQVPKSPGSGIGDAGTALRAGIGSGRKPDKPGSSCAPQVIPGEALLLPCSRPTSSAETSRHLLTARILTRA
jgi:hypothetical protein